MAQASPGATSFDAFSLAAHTVRVLDSSPGLFADELRRDGRRHHHRQRDRRAARRPSHRGRRARVPRRGGVPPDQPAEDACTTTSTSPARGSRPRRRCDTASSSSSTARRRACTATSASPPGNEDSPITPADYYQETKYQGEQAVAELVAQGPSGDDPAADGDLRTRRSGALPVPVPSRADGAAS